MSYNLLVSSLSLGCAVANAYVLTDEFGLGPVYAGIGGLSGGGATSRLLPDYQEPFKTQILDLLFKPNFAASLQLLKCEIGGTGQSTEGTEPSHMNTIDDLNFNRGYEWWLLEEAKSRNPELQTLALSWSWPSWVGCPDGNLSSPDCDLNTPYSFPEQSALYTANFVKGAQTHNVSIDIVSSWNEKAYNAEYLIALRAALDKEGFTDTKIVCDDFNWECASGMMSNPALFDAVDFVSGHNNMPPSALLPGKPVYDTEGFHTVGSDAGAEHWIVELNSRYIQYNQTMNIAWNLIAAYYEGTAFWPHGLMHAWQPWSSWYTVPASIWATAHYTQFTSISKSNRWFYSLVDPKKGGSGLLNFGGSYVSLMNSNTGDFSLIIEKMPGDSSGGTVANEVGVFTLGGRFSNSSRIELAVWSTKLAVGGMLASTSDQFLQLQNIQVVNGSFSVNISVGQILTITSLLSAGYKGSFPQSPPPSSFPAVYNDTFNDCAIDSQGTFVTDINGVLTCEDSGDPSHGIVLKQVVPKAPIRWWADTRPHSIIGDPTWMDTDVSIDFRCTNDGASSMIGVRGNILSATYITDGPDGIHAEDNLPGLWYTLTCSGGSNGNGSSLWALWPSILHVSNFKKAISHGSLTVSVPTMSWHRMRLVANNTRVQGFFDGNAVFDVDVSAENVPSSGWAGFGTISFGDFTQFDNIAIYASRSRCSSHGLAKSAVSIWPCNSASVGQRWAFSSSSPSSSTFGAITLVGNSSLCLTVADTKNKYGSYNVVVDACASPLPPAQLFSVNGNGTISTLGGSDMKPGSIMCLDVTAQSYEPSNPLDVYPCQDPLVNNQLWSVLNGELFSSGDPAEFYCAGSCN